MDEITREFLLAPPPLAAAAVTRDPFVAVAVDHGSSLVRLTTEAGYEFNAELSEPFPGVLRMRLAARPSLLDSVPWSPLLQPDLPCERLRPSESGGEITVATGSGELAWSPQAGFRMGSLCQAPPSSVPTGAFAGGPANAGLLIGLHLDPQSGVFGGGESFQGPDLRGRVRRCVNAETHGAGNLDLAYLNVPFFLTDSGWGVYVHTGAPLRADIAATHSEALVLEIPGPVADLFYYLGDPAQILASHLKATGLPGRFPDWALGVWTSRCSYLDADEVHGILDGYVTADCPLDVVHIDAWQTGNVISDLSTGWEVDRARWPVGWSAELAKRGVRLSLWHNPYLRANTSAGEDALAAGFVLRDDSGVPVGTNDMPERLLVDFTNPAAVDWWRKLVIDLVSSESVSALKCDFAEEVPPSARCFDGSSGWQVRNSYSVRYQAASSAALAAVRGEDAALFCRSGTAGAQRFPCHWVGDTPSTWDGQVAALRGCLSLSLSGFSVVGSDIGGFWTRESVAATTEAFASGDGSHFKADVEPELFARWAQWGALSPVMRFHGTGRREPWAYPDPYGAAAVEACRLRRRLAGYLGHVAAEASRSGAPMMRPMPFAFPHERAARDALQYLLGPDLLVAPVLRPGGRVAVWVPPGLWRGLIDAPDLQGPGWTSVTVEIGQFPAWVRDGAKVLEP